MSGERQAISERECGKGSRGWDDWCQNKKTKRYERHKGKSIKRKFEQAHDGKFCRPRNDKRVRDYEGRIIRKYDYG